MLTRTDKIKCDGCGKFVSFKDLADGKAIHVIDPHIEPRDEVFNTECAACASKPR